MFSRSEDETDKASPPTPLQRARGVNTNRRAHLSMSRRIFLTFGRNRSRSAIDASIIALAYSRFSVGGNVRYLSLSIQFSI